MLKETLLCVKFLNYKSELFCTLEFWYISKMVKATVQKLYQKLVASYFVHFRKF